MTCSRVSIANGVGANAAGFDAAAGGAPSQASSSCCHGCDHPGIGVLLRMWRQFLVVDGSYHAWNTGRNLYRNRDCDFRQPEPQHGSKSGRPITKWVFTGAETSISGCKQNLSKVWQQFLHFETTLFTEEARRLQRLVPMATTTSLPHGEARLASVLSS
jgi:hypothetical protein